MSVAKTTKTVWSFKDKPKIEESKPGTYDVKSMYDNTLQDLADLALVIEHILSEKASPIAI